MGIRQEAEAVIRIQGSAPIIHAIDKTIRDFQRLDYTRGEIKETLRKFYWGLEGNVDAHLINRGY